MNNIFPFFYNFAHRSILLDHLIVFFAVYFPYVVVLSAVLFFIFFHRNLKRFFWVFFAALLAWLVSGVLKHLIHTPRPFLALPNVSALFTETGYSFPSGHASFFAALAFSIFFVNKKTGYWFMFFALVIGVARIVAGVHFPIDILGGFALGAIVAYFLKNV